MRCCRVPFLAAVFWCVLGCASLGMNSVEKLEGLSPGMSRDQVEAVLGEPKSSQIREEKLVLRYTLHENWKGWVPYYFVFSKDTGRLETWYEDEAEYQRMQAQMGQTFQPVLEAGAQGGGAGAPAGPNDPSLQRWITGKFYHFSSSMVVSASSERTIDLCDDGRFRMTGEFGASGAGWGAASQGGNAGRWTISGDRSSGSITLTFSGGASKSVRYQVDSQQEQTMLFDGVKYAYAGVADCG